MTGEVDPDNQQHTPDVYKFIQYGSSSSAKQILPIIRDLGIAPRSVLDVGCGTAPWLAVCQLVFRRGKEDIIDVVGIDGDHVPRDQLEIPVEKFKPHDIREPFDLGRRFDLAICVETAEHVPPHFADQLIDCIVKHSDVVLFGAAIPGQGGIGHYNEQWPEYWFEKFQKRGYTGIDCIRPRVWDRNDVEYWFQQNCFLFVKNALIGQHKRLPEEVRLTRMHQLSLVHPKRFTG